MFQLFPVTTKSLSLSEIPPSKEALTDLSKSLDLMLALLSLNDLVLRVPVLDILLPSKFSPSPKTEPLSQLEEILSLLKVSDLMVLTFQLISKITETELMMPFIPPLPLDSIKSK
jgi:hypothetical protein